MESAHLNYFDLPVHIAIYSGSVYLALLPQQWTVGRLREIPAPVLHLGIIPEMPQLLFAYRREEACCNEKV